MNDTKLHMQHLRQRDRRLGRRQLEACTRCGMCAEACHFYQATGNPEYAPGLEDRAAAPRLRAALHRRRQAQGWRSGWHKPITDADLSHWSKIVYDACTMCNKCAMVCPMGIQIGPLIHEVRSAMSEAGVVPADLMAAVNKQVNEGSPLGVTDDVCDQRMEWVADEWEVEIPRGREGRRHAGGLLVHRGHEVPRQRRRHRQDPATPRREVDGQLRRRARSSTSASTRAARNAPMQIHEAGLRCRQGAGRQAHRRDRVRPRLRRAALDLVRT